jgi:hypothetical protein
MMLFAQALVRVCEQCSKNHDFEEQIFSKGSPLRTKVPILALEVLSKLLLAQEANGSWNDGCEVTSYAIIALAALSRLPWIQQSNDSRLSTAVERGQAYLLANRHLWRDGSHMWVEKVTYTSPVLSEAYCISAAWVKPVASQPHYLSSLVCNEKLNHMLCKAGSLLALTPLIAPLSPETLRLAELQAAYLLEDLIGQKRLAVFSSQPSPSQKHLAIVPLIWTACNAISNSGTQNLNILLEMTTFSELVYQTDHYIESVVERNTEPRLFGRIIDLVHDRCAGMAKRADGCQSTLKSHLPASVIGDEHPLRDIEDTLSRLLDYVLSHPMVKQSSLVLQKRLTRELESFLVAHLTHATDNHHFREQLKTAGMTNGGSTPNGSASCISKDETGKNGSLESEQSIIVPQFADVDRSFYSWLHSTSANTTSGPLAFVFYQCLSAVPIASSKLSSAPITTWANGKGISIFDSSPRVAYLAEDLSRHLSSMCRLYNDLGSLSRDTTERNLNSINFPEFHSSETALGGLPSSIRTSRYCCRETQSLDVKEAKQELMFIAEYERRCLQMATCELEKELIAEIGGRSADIMRSIMLFVNVTDCFGLVYVQKDLTAHIDRASTSV